MALRLPNLAPLAGGWVVTEMMFQTDVNGMVMIAPMDPNRWAIAISVNQAGNNYVTTQPVIGGKYGVQLLPNQVTLLKYSDYGGFVQDELFYYTDSPLHQFGVVLISINPTGG